MFREEEEWRKDAYAAGRLPGPTISQLRYPLSYRERPCEQEQYESRKRHDRRRTHDNKRPPDNRKPPDDEETSTLYAETDFMFEPLFMDKGGCALVPSQSVKKWPVPTVQRGCFIILSGKLGLILAVYLQAVNYQ
jgi:hypothetical protein